MTDTVISRWGTPIRLTDERWSHIVEGHSELVGLRPRVLNALENAERILEGNNDELFAVQESEPGKWIVVIYKELNGDGHVITAFLTSKERWLNRRRQLWP